MHKLTVFVCLMLAALLAQGQKAEKKPKDQGEYDIYNEVLKDINGSSFAKALSDLDTWKQKYADTDYSDERKAFYVQAYAGAGQPAKSVDAAGELLSRDLETIFPGPAGQATVIRLLYNAAWAISHVPNPTAEQLAVGDKAAHRLLDYDKQLPGASAEQWAQARADMKEKATAALMYIAMRPGAQAMAKQPPDCAAAEAAYAAAVGAYPDKAALAYELGRALSCEAKQNRDKLSLAIYAFERAAVVDATLGDPKNDAKKIRDFADNYYVRVHGSDEGLAQLKEQVKQSALAPAGFKVKTASEIAEEKEALFEKSNPQLAMWMKIKGALADTAGEQYFESQLKNSAVPVLRGTLVAARPACRPKELLVAVPLPDAQQPLKAEITLKLDKALAGKPEANAEFQWEGVPTAFSKEPFDLTMETEAAKLQGLKTAPCAVTARKK
jgi:hypothetical protein